VTEQTERGPGVSLQCPREHASDHAPRLALSQIRNDKGLRDLVDGNDDGAGREQ